MPRLSKWMVALRDIGVNQQDFTQIRRLRTVNVAAILAAGLTAVYGVFYAFYDAVLFSAEIRTLWVTGAGYCSVLLASRAGRIEVAMWLLLGTGILQVTLISWLLGRESGVPVYLLIIPFVTSLIVDERDRISIWPVTLIAGILFVFVVQGDRTGHFDQLPPNMQTVFFLSSILGALLMASAVAIFYRWLILTVETELETERQRSDRLLHAILPVAVVQRLKSSNPDVIAEQVPGATAVFADLAGFTAWSANKEPETVVIELNRIFSAVDELSRKHRIEKIKTIGDAYFAVCGVPEPLPDHAERVADFALELNAAAPELGSPAWPNPRFRIVLATGLVVAGVIGRSKFAYDVWGNTINTAARMEPHCAPGEILMTEATAEALPNRFSFENIGPVELRDRGPTCLFRLLARSSARKPAEAAS